MGCLKRILPHADRKIRASKDGFHQGSLFSRGRLKASICFRCVCLFCPWLKLKFEGNLFLLEICFLLCPGFGGLCASEIDQRAGSPVLGCTFPASLRTRARKKHPNCLAQVGSFLKMLSTFISPSHGFKLEEGVIMGPQMEVAHQNRMSFSARNRLARQY